MNFWVIDRIEDNLVICQDENFNTIKINKELIVGILKEGYIIRKENVKIWRSYISLAVVDYTSTDSDQTDRMEKKKG
mgnify:CR=1 FL=1